MAILLVDETEVYYINLGADREMFNGENLF
jgi:hypothetical protein